MRRPAGQEEVVRCWVRLDAGHVSWFRAVLSVVYWRPSRLSLPSHDIADVSRHSQKSLWDKVPVFFPEALCMAQPQQNLWLLLGGRISEGFLEEAGNQIGKAAMLLGIFFLIKIYLSI